MLSWILVVRMILMHLSRRRQWKKFSSLIRIFAPKDMLSLLHHAMSIPQLGLDQCGQDIYSCWTYSNHIIMHLTPLFDLPDIEVYKIFGSCCLICKLLQSESYIIQHIMCIHALRCLDNLSLLTKLLMRMKSWASWPHQSLTLAAESASMSIYGYPRNIASLLLAANADAALPTSCVLESQAWIHSLNLHSTSQNSNSASWSLFVVYHNWIIVPNFFLICHVIKLFRDWITLFCSQRARLAQSNCFSCHENIFYEIKFMRIACFQCPIQEDEITLLIFDANSSSAYLLIRDIILEGLVLSLPSFNVWSSGSKLIMSKVFLGWVSTIYSVPLYFTRNRTWNSFVSFVSEYFNDASLMIPMQTSDCQAIWHFLRRWQRTSSLYPQESHENSLHLGLWLVLTFIIRNLHQDLFFQQSS